MVAEHGTEPASAVRTDEQRIGLEDTASDDWPPCRPDIRIPVSPQRRSYCPANRLITKSAAFACSAVISPWAIWST